MKVKIRILIFLVFIGSLTAFGQKNEKQFNIRTIAFYNVENLFDTINDPDKNDEASPIMELKGNRSKVYWSKMDNMAMVIS